MSDLSLEERREILIELETESSSLVRERHNIDNRVLQHIKWHHHPEGGAAKRGQYHKDLLEEYEDPTIEEVKLLKSKGFTSGQISEKLGMPLEKVNKIFIKK